jgi:hypothetical protein
MKIYYVPIDARWLERIRKEAAELRQVQRELAPLDTGRSEEVQRILGTCSGELENIRWSAFNHDVVVKEGKPLWHEKGEEGAPEPMPFLLDWFELGRMLYEQDDGIGHSLRVHEVAWVQLPPGIQQDWANRAERAVRAFIDLLPPDIQQRIKTMMLEEMKSDADVLYEALVRWYAETWRRDSQGKLLTSPGFLMEQLGKDRKMIDKLLEQLQEEGRIRVHTWKITDEITELHITLFR